MIRFVPIAAELDVIYQTECFAFFNTTTGKFIELSGDHVFENVKDLEEAWNLEDGVKPELKRLTSKVPSDKGDLRLPGKEKDYEKGR